LAPDAEDARRYTDKVIAPKPVRGKLCNTPKLRGMP